MAEYLPYKYRGEVEPIRKPRFTQPPLVHKHVLIGETGDGDIKKFASLKFWIHKPTIEYPDTSMFFSLQNGKGSVYQRLSSVDDLAKVVTFMNEIYMVAKQYKEAYSALEETMKAQKIQLYETTAG